MEKDQYYGLARGPQPSWKTRGGSPRFLDSAESARAQSCIGALGFSSERFARGHGRAEHGCRVYRQSRERYSAHHAPDGPARMVAMVLRDHGHSAAADGDFFFCFSSAALECG